MGGSGSGRAVRDMTVRAASHRQCGRQRCAVEGAAVAVARAAEAAAAANGPIALRWRPRARAPPRIDATRRSRRAAVPRARHAKNNNEIAQFVTEKTETSAARLKRSISPVVQQPPPHSCSCKLIIFLSNILVTYS